MDIRLLALLALMVLTAWAVARLSAVGRRIDDADLAKLRPAYAPQSVPCPGETLEETIQNMNITRTELSRRIRVPKEHVDQLIVGTLVLSPELAKRLELVTGVPASMWNTMEATYRSWLAGRETS